MRKKLVEFTIFKPNKLVREKKNGKTIPDQDEEKKRSIVHHLSLDIWQLSMLLGHCSVVFPNKNIYIKKKNPIQKQKGFFFLKKQNAHFNTPNECKIHCSPFINGKKEKTGFQLVNFNISPSLTHVQINRTVLNIESISLNQQVKQEME